MADDEFFVTLKHNHDDGTGNIHLNLTVHGAICDDLAGIVDSPQFDMDIQRAVCAFLRSCLDDSILKDDDDLPVLTWLPPRNIDILEKLARAMGVREDRVRSVESAVQQYLFEKTEGVASIPCGRTELQND